MCTNIRRCAHNCNECGRALPLSLSMTYERVPAAKRSLTVHVRTSLLIIHARVQPVSESDLFDPAPRVFRVTFSCMTARRLADVYGLWYESAAVVKWGNHDGNLLLMFGQC